MRQFTKWCSERWKITPLLSQWGTSFCDYPFPEKVIVSLHKSVRLPNNLLFGYRLFCRTNPTNSRYYLPFFILSAQRKCHDHENILKIIKCFEKGSVGDMIHYCIVMEYCELGNLFSFKEEYWQQHNLPFSDRWMMSMKRYGSCSCLVVWRMFPTIHYIHHRLSKSMMMQLASAVDHIHSKSIVHRDLKVHAAIHPFHFIRT